MGDNNVRKFDNCSGVLNSIIISCMLYHRTSSEAASIFNMCGNYLILEVMGMYLEGLWYIRNCPWNPFMTLLHRTTLVRSLKERVNNRRILEEGLSTLPSALWLRVADCQLSQYPTLLFMESSCHH